MSRHVIVKPLGTRLLLAFALAAVAAVAAAAPAGAISGGTVDSATAPLYPEVVAIGYKPPPDLPPQFQGPPCRRASRRSWPTRCPPGPDSYRRPLRVAGRAALRLLRRGRPAHVDVVDAGSRHGGPAARRRAMTKATPRTWASSRSRTPSPPGITPATLPAAGALATLRQGDLLAIVGFGCERLAQNGGPANLRCGNFTRRYTTAPFQALRPFMLALNANTASGAQGGACLADSGGPVFRPDDARPERCWRPHTAATRSATRSSASTARTRRGPRLSQIARHRGALGVVGDEAALRPPL
jgi:hypothetical protein